MVINLFEILPKDVQKLLITKYFDAEVAYDFALSKVNISDKQFSKIKIRYITEKLRLPKNSFIKMFNYQYIREDWPRKWLQCFICKAIFLKKNTGSHQRKCQRKCQRIEIDKCKCCNMVNTAFLTAYVHLRMKRKYYCPFKSIWDCPNCNNVKQKTLPEVIHHFNKKCVGRGLCFTSPNRLTCYTHNPHYLRNDKGCWVPARFKQKTFFMNYGKLTTTFTGIAGLLLVGYCWLVMRITKNF